MYTHTYNQNIRKEAIKLREEGLFAKDIAKRLNSPSVGSITRWVRGVSVVQKKPKHYINNFSFEEIKLALFKWAHYFSKKNNKYDFWELVSVVWLKGKVQHVNCIKFASCRVKQDIIDYMREQGGRDRHSYSGKEDRKHMFERRKQSLDLVVSNKGQKEFCVKDTLYVRHNYFDAIDTKDVLEFIFSSGFLSEIEKKILRLRFYKNLTMKEISVQLGCSEGSISLKLNKMLSRLKFILVHKGITCV